MIIAILLAAGSGSRFDSEKPKQFCLLGGKPLLEYSFDVLNTIEEIDFVVLVINKEYESDYDPLIKKSKRIVYKVAGGATRQLSVYNALLFLENHKDVDKNTNVLIHDSARPFSGKVFDAVIKKLERKNAVVPVIDLIDTIYRYNGEQVVEIPQRREYVKVQTPQGFRFCKLLLCHEKAYETNNVMYNDDGSIYMRYSNEDLTIAEGDSKNFKITKPIDLEMAEFILNNNQV